MTVASFLTILSAVIWDAIIADHLWQDEVSSAIAYRISYTFGALYLFNPILNPLFTAAWLAQSGEHRSVEQEVAGSSPGRTNTQGLNNN